jgi:hypothetical protein
VSIFTPTVSQLREARAITQLSLTQHRRYFRLTADITFSGGACAATRDFHHPRPRLTAQYVESWKEEGELIDLSTILHSIRANANLIHPITSINFRIWFAFSIILLHAA